MYIFNKNYMHIKILTINVLYILLYTETIISILDTFGNTFNSKLKYFFDFKFLSPKNQVKCIREIS